jgi:hypothetical protein
MFRTLWLLPLLALSLLGSDVSGRWSGSIEVNDPSSGERINTPVKAEFSQSAASLSGKIGRREDEECEPIRNGKVEGDTLIFEVRAPEMSGIFKFQLTLVAGNRIEGEMKGAIDTGPIAGTVKLAREAPGQAAN